MKWPNVPDWRSTVVGFAQSVNAIIMAIQALRAENQGVVFIEPKVWFRFLVIGAVLKGIGGFVTKDAGKGSDRSQEIVDEKLDHVPPKD